MHGLLCDRDFDVCRWHASLYMSVLYEAGVNHPLCETNAGERRPPKATTSGTRAQVARWWHYDATRLLHGQRIFWSSSAAHPFPRLLLLSPHTPLATAASSADLKRMLLGLVIAGHLSERTWVWPALRCDSTRFRRADEPWRWTGVDDAEALPYGGRDALRCIDLELTWNGCMEVCHPSSACAACSCSQACAARELHLASLCTFLGCCALCSWHTWAGSE